MTEWAILLFVGVAWWNIDRAIRRAGASITGRLDKIEACLERIDRRTAPDPKDLEALLGEALEGE